MGRMSVSCADSCGSHLVHISHHRCWLEEFTLAPRLHRPFCDPCLLPSPSCSSLQNLPHLFPEVSSPSPSWQPFNVDTHPTAQLSHPPSHTALGPGIFWDLWPPNPLHPQSFLSWTLTSNILSSPGFLPAAKYLHELLSSSRLPHAHHLRALWVLAGFLQTLQLPTASPPVSSVWCSPVSDTVAEPSPSFGSLLRNRFQDPTPMRLKTTWTQTAPAKKNLPTHNFEGRREEYIQTKIKRKHRNVIVLSEDRSQRWSRIFDPRQKTPSHRLLVSWGFILFVMN